jgi:hypothetical protein
VTKKLTLQEVHWGRRTVQFDKGAKSAGAAGVNTMCDQLFAGTRFSFDENRGIGNRDRPNLIQHSTQGRARPYNCFKFVPDVCTALRLFQQLIEINVGVVL